MSFGNFKAPKNDSKYYWTRHSVGKMMQYGLSAQRVIRVIRSYQRIELGVAKNTVAVMQPVSVKRDKEGKQKWSQEIWVMYQTPKASIKNETLPTGRTSPKAMPTERRQVSKQIQNSKLEKQNEKSDISNLKQVIFGKNQLKIISAWRYPGVSPKNNPIPQDILDELDDVI